jgi:hypothetical protein
MAPRQSHPTPSAIGGQGDPSLVAPEPFPNLQPPTGAPTELPPLPGAPLPEQPEAKNDDDLSPEEEIMFASLLTCGRRSKTVTVFDHTVVVETINCDDDLRIGMYVKDYQGSLGEQRAYQVGVVAAGIRSIDGQPFMPSGLFQDADRSAMFDDRFKKVSAMYPTVVSQLYRGVMDAEKEYIELAIRLGKLDG